MNEERDKGAGPFRSKLCRENRLFFHTGIGSVRMADGVSSLILKKVYRSYMIFLGIILAGTMICGCNNGSQDPSAGNRMSGDAVQLKVGETLSFGSYEQDNDPDNGAEPIEWQVLSVEDGRALLISKFGLDAKVYNTTYINVTWLRSTLRSWLNGEFYDTAFSPSEKARIAEVKISNQGNQFSRARGGLPTKDRIFLLSFDEANSYFTDDDARQCEATKYAKAKGAYVDGNGKSWWWLRTPGSKNSSAAIVLSVGYVSNVGHVVLDPSDLVRPVFWLNL